MLDFIGQQRREFRFDLKYRALTGTSRQQLQRQVEQGFAFLPSGCELVLDPVARGVVLDNVKRQLQLNRKELAAELRSHGDLDLREWLEQSGRDLADVLDFEATTGLSETVSGGSNTIDLVVQGDTADDVSLNADGGTAWTLAGSQVLDGAYGGGTYDLYTNGSEWVAIEQGIAVDTP